MFIKSYGILFRTLHFKTVHFGETVFAIFFYKFSDKTKAILQCTLNVKLYSCLALYSVQQTYLLRRYFELTWYYIKICFLLLVGFPQNTYVLPTPSIRLPRQDVQQHAPIQTRTLKLVPILMWRAVFVMMALYWKTVYASQMTRVAALHQKADTSW